MKENKRTTNILLRVTDAEKNIIDLKSKLFNRKTSDYLRHSAFSYWENSTDTKHFKILLKEYQEGDEVVKKEVVELLFKYYRTNGFPHNIFTDEEKENRMGRVIGSKNILLDNNHLQMNPQGVDLANSFHPHMMEAYYSRGDLSPYQTFYNDDKLKDCINRWMEIGKVPNLPGMRRILKTRNGTRGVVNFKPTIAKFIYDKYCKDNSKVLDSCAGYGGRLVGCIASNKNILYHGIDPNEKTVMGNTKLAAFFMQQYDAIGERIYKYRFRHDIGMAEEIMPEIKEEYDLIFTSPPYYDIEVYSNDINQSGNKYKSYEEWLERFLWVIVNESKRILKQDGRLIINVKNLVEYEIANDVVNYCVKDWDLEETYHMRVSNSEYYRKDNDAFHTEPIFVWKKK